MPFHEIVGPIGGTEFFLAFSIFGLIVGLWIYRDAHRRSVDHPALWAAVVGFLFLFYFIVGIAGLVVYLALRDQLSGKQNQIPEDGDDALHRTE